MKKLFLILGMVMSLALITPAYAQLGAGLTNLNTATKNTGLKSSLQETVGTVIKAVLAMVGTIFLGLTIYAGILWMTASGNEEQVTKAVDIIKAAIIGLFITMSAYAITYFVASKVGGSGTEASSVAPATSGTGADSGLTVTAAECRDFGKDFDPPSKGGGCLEASYNCDPPGGDIYSGETIGKCDAKSAGVQMDCCLFKE